MTCLQDYIGLRGCGAAVPPSGLYVNDLPGISLKQLVNLTNEEETTYVQLWDVIQKRAMNRFSLDVREAMGKHYKLNSLMQGVNLGNQVGTLVVDNWPGLLGYNGFVIELIDNPSYQYTPSPLASIHVQELRFYAPMSAQNQNFIIFDINTGELLWNTFVNISANTFNIIPVNKTFHNNYSVNSWRIGCFFLDQGDITNYYNFDLPNNHTVPGCCDIRVTGAYGDGPSDPYFQYTSKTYGLTGTFSIVCSWDAVICQNKTLFSRAFWYLCGIELLTEQLYSTKLNLFTTTNLQRAKELREEYQVEYAKSLEQVAGGFKLDCDCCIDCAGQVQLRETNQFF